MPTEVLFGFLGLVVGALIGFGGDAYINNRRMKFEAYKDVKFTLNQMHNKLIDIHSKILQFYSDNRKLDPKENIKNLKNYHWQVMEIYKEFRVYFGDLKAYELQSAVYNFYYELAKDDTHGDDFKDHFYNAYQALKDSYALMISELKLGLVSVNFIKKADKNIEKSKNDEYKEYSNRLKKTLDEHLLKLVDETYEEEAVSKAAKVVKIRTSSFEEEYNYKNKPKS